MQKDVWRNMIRIAVLAVFGVAAVSLAASAETPLLVGRSNSMADAELAAQVGLELGFFKKHGLDVEYVDFAGGSRLIQAMTAGSVGLGVGAATGMALVAKGAPILAVCENTATLPYFAVGVPWDSPVHKLSELKGKKIAVSESWLAHRLAGAGASPAKKDGPPTRSVALPLAAALLLSPRHSARIWSMPISGAR